MIKFFEYNWQVRDEWVNWCNQLTTEELLQDRIGGVGSILYTLFHIIDVEYSWIRGIQGKEDVVLDFDDYKTLAKVKTLSTTLRLEIVEFLKSHLDGKQDRIVTVPWDKGEYTKNEILHHIIAHEIHHIGQLSVWAREKKLTPVSANFIGRKLKSVHAYEK
ncbi:DinB family protein [Bacillus safensis]|uniref:DinB family protein n=1 Tax=Bacillus TaxID=1386 RepID=UPI0007DC293A|nr:MULTISPECIES: DinB family protein [Bacillus]MBW4849603.1 DinB family protein [Bacillaceae bacterium]MBW4852213.1 DinB family protein [Bacillaceae bacterium]MBW4856454.1 DinB family protein [Bacillaceae bacterium]MCY7584810.1 DinB family protein [Bacillus safensis]MCY7588903.1 DinB family protein [Bacillus safensis]